MSCAIFREAYPGSTAPIAVNRVNFRGILNPGIPRWVLPAPGPVYPPMAGPSPLQFPPTGACGSVGWMPEDFNLVYGDASIQNANPPLMPHLNPTYTVGTTSGTPAQPNAWFPELLLIPSTAPNQTAIPQSTLDINIFVDTCVVNGAYPEGQYDVTSTGGTWQAGGGPCGAAVGGNVGTAWKCTKIFLTIAPQFGYQTTTAPWGATILNHYPTAEFEVNGQDNSFPFPSAHSRWTPCNAYPAPWQGGAPATVNLCPSPALGAPAGYTPCNEGYYSPIQLIRGVAGAWSFLANQTVQVQATYMIPHTKNLNQHLIFSSQILPYQIL